MKYRATIHDMASGKEAIVFPRTRKTTLFLTVAAATKALERRRFTSDGFIGRVYEIDHAADNGRRLILNIAL
jgi:hypothetical protein